MADNKPTPAFPVVAGQHVYSTGMTMRDYFAAQIVGGLAANSVSTHPDVTASESARICYAMADAMIAERERSND